MMRITSYCGATPTRKSIFNFEEIFTKVYINQIYPTKNTEVGNYYLLIMIKSP